MHLLYLRDFLNSLDFPFYVCHSYHDKDFQMHKHVDFSELVIVLDGTATHCVNNETYFIKRGDVFVVNGDTEHEYRNTDGFLACTIMYYPEIFFSPFLDIRKSTGFHALFVIEPYFTKSQGFKSRLVLDKNEFERVKTMTSIMIDEYDKKLNGWQTMTRAYFLSLITILSRLYSLPAYDINTNVINIAKSVAHIESYFNEAISVSNLASLSNLSVRHYLRCFKDTYKTTPSNYIFNLRLQYACQLLKNTSIKISDVALQSGFNDFSYFTRRFHKSFGINPSEYRNFASQRDNEN